MKVRKTVKIPVHHKTTKKKLSYLNRLTARLTYAVREWSKVIGENNLKKASDCSPYEKEIQGKTNLSAGFVQQARDKALWMWKQYREMHEKWEKKLERARGK